METTSDRYRRLSSAFATTVEAVPDTAWSNPSPCPGWSARDLVRHVVDSQNLFLGLVGRPPVDAPSVDDDPAAAWSVTSSAIQHDLENPATAGAEFDGFFGRTTFATAVERFLCLDLVVHRWDLARAAGLDATIDPDDAEFVMDGAAGMGEGLRGPGAFGAALEAPAGAGVPEQMLAFLGRAV